MPNADKREIRIRGGQHHQFKEAVDAGILKEQAELSLRRDPENQYDPRAIKAFAGSFFIGFVAAEQAKQLYWRFDRGAVVQRCTVTKVEEAGRCNAWLEIKGGWHEPVDRNEPKPKPYNDENLDDDIPF